MTDGYPFIFQMIDRSGADQFLIETLQYRFKSSRSHHAYIVRVECYISHAYCLKFFDKANINSMNKFSIRTNTFEPRTIFYTLYHIMLDVLRRDECATSSFSISCSYLAKNNIRYQRFSEFLSTRIQRFFIFALWFKNDKDLCL